MPFLHQVFKGYVVLQNLTFKLRENYINGQFGDELEGWEWNAYERIEDGHLTNNNAEGGNNRLMTRAKTPHPGLYRFCDLIKKSLDMSKISVNNLKLATCMQSNTSGSGGRQRHDQNSKTCLKTSR